MSWREVLKADFDFSQYPVYDGKTRRKLSSFEQEMVEQNKKGDYKVRECENCDVIQHRGRPLMYEVQFVNLPSRSGRPEFGGHYCDVCLERNNNLNRSFSENGPAFFWHLRIFFGRYRAIPRIKISTKIIMN